MAKIDVYTSEMSSLSARLKKISSVIENAEQVTEKVQSNLDFQVAAKADIAGALSRTRKQLRQQKDKVVKMADLTTASAAEFRNADGQMDKSARNILGKIVAPLTNVVRGVNKLFVGAAVSRYKSINSLFMPAGTIITVAGISELIRRLAQIINGWKQQNTDSTAGTISGAGSGANTGAATTPVDVPKPEVVNTGSSAQNAKNAGIAYYPQGEKSAHWETDSEKVGKNYSYKSSKACAICCTAMIASHFGVNVSPSELIAENGGDASWDGSGVTKLMKKNGLENKRIAPKNATLQEKVDCLDNYLTKYQADPENNAPPMISIPSDTSNAHYVLVLGKDQNGDYIIVDPASDKRTTLKITAGKNGKNYGKETGYECPIKGVFTWAKK